MKTIKTFLVGATLAFSLASTGQAADLKIGYVNYQKLLEESPQAKAAAGLLETEFGPKQRELVNLQKSLKDKADKLQRDGAVMSEPERGKVEREVRDGERELSRRANELQEDINLRRNEEIGKINRLLLGEVQTYARANGYDLVLSDGVVYAGEGIDVTAQLISALKARAPAPAAPAAAPAAQPPKK
ncbi:MAG: OmpH family outer membrane protein [Gammaproteobacteria bacterium]|nr:OmpH family outer membrane protein [Gammaproteobacteria bacterium]